ncbi:MAG TPA: hypothetical protein VEF04_14095, partial [Blastocatellia bacterium]|nr:hypothetical protein [Blastocatellia bacterium]
MKRQNQDIFALVPRGGIALSILLLSVGVANAQPTRSKTLLPLDSSVIAQQLDVPQSGELMAQVPSNEVVAEQVQAEVNRTLGRAITLFNVLLTVLIVLLGTAIATLWFLRRAVINEIAIRAKEQIEELGTLEVQVTKATEDAREVLDAAEAIAERVEHEAKSLQKRMAQEKGHLADLAIDLSETKAQLLTELQTQLQTAKQRLAEFESDFTTHIAELQSGSQERQAQTLETFAIAERDFAGQLTQLQAIAQQHKDAIVADLEAVKAEFTPQVTELHTVAQHQQAEVLEKLHQSEQHFVGQLAEFV